MGSIFIIQGILIYIYAFDHRSTLVALTLLQEERKNPPHIHVRSGTDNFSITIQDRVIEGKARSKSVKIINDFIDEHEAELMEPMEQRVQNETCFNFAESSRIRGAARQERVHPVRPRPDHLLEERCRHCP